MGTWLPFVGTMAAALTAGVVALLIDARRRADAVRARLHEARLTLYAEYMAATDDETVTRGLAYKDGRSTQRALRFWQSAVKAELLMTDETLRASQRLVEMVKGLSRLDQPDAQVPEDERALRKAATWEAAHAPLRSQQDEVLRLMRKELGIRR